MKFLEIFFLALLIAKNEGRTIMPKSDTTTVFTKITSENGEINEDHISQEKSNDSQDENSQRLKSLMEELLLKRRNNFIEAQLLPPNYNEREFVTESATNKSNKRDKTDLSDSTNESNQNAQPDELSSIAEQELLLHRIEKTDPVFELSTNKTNFDDHNLTVNISGNSTHNGTNHTKVSASDSTERHATISLHIYSTSEQDGSDEHPIDHLSVDVKHIGGTEALTQQLDFLQKNAENIKKQQHIVGDNAVYIVERGVHEDQYVKVEFSNASSYHTHLIPSVATSYSENVIQNSSTNMSPELPMPIVHSTETNEEPNTSNAIPNIISGSKTFPEAPTNTNNGDPPRVPLTEAYGQKSNVTQSVDPPTHTVGMHHIIPLMLMVPTESSSQAEMSLSSESTSKLQEYGPHSITQNQPLSYNSYVANGESNEKASFPKPLENLTKHSPTKLKPNSSSSSFASDEDLSQTSEVIYNLGFKEPQKTVDTFLFEPSEPIAYMRAPTNTFHTVNIDEAFERLTEIFEEYSIPISSVVQQLSSSYESTQKNAISPPKTEAFTEKHERPDGKVDSETQNGADSVELGYGSGYTILQSQLGFLHFNRTKDKAGNENSSEEKFSYECNGMCAEDAEGEAPTITYISDEYGASSEREFLLNDPSATAHFNVKVETTNPAKEMETILSPTEVMTLFDDTTPQSATYRIATIANESANNLEHLEVAIENDVRKEIENIDKTNETQVETTHQHQQQQQQQQQHQLYFTDDSELLAGNTNDKSTRVTAGLQHIGTTLLLQPDKTPVVEGAQGERIRVPKPEVMCSKTEIIKSEQYSKTNENGHETENENEEPQLVAGRRVLLGRSLSYTISCHIRKPEPPATANITAEIGNNREKIIKNHEQLTITSGDDSRNGLPVRRRGAQQPAAAEPIERRAEMDSSGNKASDGAAAAGVGTADSDGSGYYDAGHDAEDSAESGAQSGENYYTDIEGAVHEMDGDAEADGDVDGDADVVGDDYVTGAASLHANGIQTRVRQAAAMTAVAQLTTGLETDNGKTHEYDTGPPLQGGLSDKDVNFESVEHVAASAVDGKNTKQMDGRVDGADKDYQDDDDNDDNHDDDDGNSNAFIDAVELETSDYVTENGSKYREAAKTANMDRTRDGIDGANGADAAVGADNMLQYKLSKAEAVAVEEQENIESYSAELLKTETESTKLKNVRVGIGDAHNDASEADDDDGDDGKGEKDDASDEYEEAADGSGTAADVETEDSSALLA